MTTAYAEGFGQVEYGDFQTPDRLARRVIEVVARKGLNFHAVMEPNCGLGSILFAAAEHLPGLQVALGLDVNPAYVEAARAHAGRGVVPRVELADFFQVDLAAVTSELPQPYVFIGNPPWVTSAAVGQLEGSNLPRKENFQGFTGFDALTGKSNFDISEWILIQLLENVAGTDNACAMLIKTSVARKIIAYASRKGLTVRDFEVYAIDAKKEFDVSVSACLFYFRGATSAADVSYTHTTYTDLDGANAKPFAYMDGHFVGNLEAFARTQGYGSRGQSWWRSGLKHDLSRVMELRRLAGRLINGVGEPVDIEPDLVYPFLKSSDVAKGVTAPRMYTIVTQRTIGAPTAGIEHDYPRTWAYLMGYKSLFNGRKSSIYRGKPPFSIFGVGDYSFAPYKIAISGLYKRLQFTLLEPLDGKCIMLDDTCYFIGFNDPVAARVHLAALCMPDVQTYFDARITWDDKRPIKKDVLDSFDLKQFVRDHAETLQDQVVSAGLPAEVVADWFRQNA